MLRLRGAWLALAGFSCGARVRAEVREGKLALTLLD